MKMLTIGAGVKRRLGAAGTTVVMTAGLIGVGGLISAAEAHTPQVTPTCGSLAVNMQSYNTTHPNHITVVVDGTTLENNTSFGASFVKSYTVSKTATHTYNVHVVAWDDPTGSNGWTKTFTGSIPLCQVPVPAQPSYTDACGPGNASWNVPADTAQLDWTLLPNGHLVVQTKNGLHFTDGTTSHDYGVAPDSGNLCTVPVPPTPSYTDACGPGNAYWNVPADTDQVTWMVTPDGHLIATAHGVTFTDGTTTHDYGVAPDSNTPCPVPPTQVTGHVRWKNPCGTAHDWFKVVGDNGVVATDNGKSVSLNKRHYVTGKQHIVLGAKPGYVFSGIKVFDLKFSAKACPFSHPKAHLVCPCTGKPVGQLNNDDANVVATFTPRAMYKGQLVYRHPVNVAAGTTRTTRFSGLKFKPGTVLTVKSGGKLLDRLVVPAACPTPPHHPPHTGEKHATGGRSLLGKA